MVLLKDIPVRSLCEHHMLGFIGVAHVGYLPKDRILGLSKLARLVEYFALRQPQVQERLTEQIVDWLDTTLAPRGAGAVLEAEHLCMTMRGVQAPGTRAITSALRGGAAEGDQDAGRVLQPDRRLPLIQAADKVPEGAGRGRRSFGDRCLGRMQVVSQAEQAEGRT
jgi:GTP cyclohydrolase IA